MAEEIQLGPERRRGEQQARFGTSVGRLGPGGRRLMTASESAAWKLNKALEVYPKFTREKRQIIQDEFVNMQNLKTMNMDVFAAVLAFIEDNKPIPGNFKDNKILPYMTYLLPSKQNENYSRLVTRYKAQFLIYIRAITIFRS